MNTRATKLISALVASIGMFVAANSANATVLLDLVNAPGQTNTAYSLSFVATNSTTTLSVAGFQVPSAETASQNGVFLNGTGSNLLGQTWDFVAAASGSFAGQGNDGSSVNALGFLGTSAGFFDTFSQTFATNIGSTYSYNFLFTENASVPNEFKVTVDGTGSNVPEPASLALLGLGLVGLVVSRRRKTI